MLFVIYLAWMSPTYCNSRQNVFDAYEIGIKNPALSIRDFLSNIQFVLLVIYRSILFESYTMPSLTLIIEFMVKYP
jgi:hypothetical protein